MGNCWVQPHEQHNRSESYGVPTSLTVVPRRGLRHDGPHPQLVDMLVSEMLTMIATYVDNAERSPVSLLQLHLIADREVGWIQVLRSIVDVIPLEDPFGMSAIAILLDDCPLPSKDTVVRVSRLFGLSADKAVQPGLNVRVERNICVVLGCIAEKLAGPNSVAVLTEDTLDYLLGLLMHCVEPCLVLYALIALEKFAATTENKLRIKERMEQEADHPLAALERHVGSINLDWRQVGFCAQWALDNIFVIPGRDLSYLRADMRGTNAVLNAHDASEYLKIGSDGLEARCDSHSFESVRCTYQIDEGCWYYECQVITPGVMQIGWATKNSHFLNHEGYGIGDDHYSSAYDGCRRLLWHEAKPTPVASLPAWRAGDVLGCLLDATRREVFYSLNGRVLQGQRQMFVSARSGFFAAASFMAFQQCRFNFGREQFRHAPRDRTFRTFNAHGQLSDEQKQVIPRRLLLEQLRDTAPCEDSCTLCCDEPACVVLAPCGHRGFCSICAAQVSECPLCRATIVDVRVELTPRPPEPSEDPEDPAGASGDHAVTPDEPSELSDE